MFVRRIEIDVADDDHVVTRIGPPRARDLAGVIDKETGGSTTPGPGPDA